MSAIRCISEEQEVVVRCLTQGHVGGLQGVGNLSPTHHHLSPTLNKHTLLSI